MTAPAPAGRGLRAMLEVRPAPRRWPRALRAAVCMGVPVLVGWLDRRRTTQRALERFVGTRAGLLLAAAVIATHPHALWPSSSLPLWHW